MRKLTFFQQLIFRSLFFAEELEEPVSPPPMAIKLKVHDDDGDDEHNGEESSKSDVLLH